MLQMYQVVHRTINIPYNQPLYLILHQVLEVCFEAAWNR